MQDLKCEERVASPSVFTRKSKNDLTKNTPDPLLNPTSGKSSRIKFVSGNKSRQKNAKQREKTAMDEHKVIPV